MRKVWIKTDATTEPVTLTEAKLYCKITGTGDDTIITNLIKAAREQIEVYTGRSLAEKTYQVQYDRMTQESFPLPCQPIKSVSSVKLVSEDSTEISLTLNSNYYLIGAPFTQMRLSGVYSTRSPQLLVEFIAGYGATGCPVLPQALKDAILKRILVLYTHRGDEGMINNEGYELASPYKDDVWLA
jgi:uncharacterized phiE125 gp8 family phage protein